MNKFPTSSLGEFILWIICIAVITLVFYGICWGAFELISFLWGCYIGNH